MPHRMPHAPYHVPLARPTPHPTGTNLREVRGALLPPRVANLAVPFVTVGEAHALVRGSGLGLGLGLGSGLGL
eukprot:scaffold105228_cov30-Phaeocystis_antarctica.AAC.1